MPETEAEQNALGDLLANGGRYLVSLEAVVTVLDRDAVRAAVRKRLESARFEDEDARTRVTEAVESDFSEALQFLVDAGGIFAEGDGLHVRSATVRVRPCGG